MVPKGSMGPIDRSLVAFARLGPLRWRQPINIFEQTLAAHVGEKKKACDPAGIPTEKPGISRNQPEEMMETSQAQRKPKLFYRENPT